MADSNEDRTVPNTPILNRIQDSNSLNRNLPRGACNYRDKGSDGQKCGCRQYFDETFGRSGSGSLWFCICEHHACFHDQGDVGERSFASSQLQSLRLGNDPEHTRYNMDPFAGYTHASNTQIGSQSCREGLDVGTGLIFPTLQSSLPDSLSWNLSAQPSQSGVTALPPIPPNCLLPSQERIDRENEHGTRGTQSSASIISNEKKAFADLRPSLFLPSQNKATLPSNFTNQQRITSTQECNNDSLNQSHCAQDQLIMINDENEANIDLENGVDNLLPTERLQQLSSPIRSIRREVSNLSTLVKAHGERLDSMENFSFSATDSSDVHGKLQERQEEIEDRFISVDIRQDEFDGRLMEIENFRDNDSSRGGVVQRTGNNDSFTGGSFTSSVNASDPSPISKLWTQLLNVKAEVRTALPPTRDRPWTVEIVFLPFGYSLKGIWSTIEEFPSQVSRRSSVAADDWVQNQLPAKASAQNKQHSEDHPSSWEGIVANQNRNDKDFLVARSFNRNSKMYARLKSRGCVRTIQITGSQSKDVNAALIDSFGDLPETLSGKTDKNLHKRHGRLTKPYHALQSSWIPLRKLHKDSRLRFLDPSELISQTLWTVEFLKSSVVMRAPRLPILFLTHPQGYTQHVTNLEDHWTWPKIRLMPRVNLDSLEDEVKEGDAMEPCWFVCFP